MNEEDILSYVMDRLQCMEECGHPGAPPCAHSPQDSRFTISRIFKWWLWVPDANEEVVRFVFSFNAVHLTAIYLARTLALAASGGTVLQEGCMHHCSLTARGLLDELAACSTAETPPSLFVPHADTPYAQLTLRQYRDVVESVQWQWSVMVQKGNKTCLAVISQHVDALFCLFGYFASIEAGEELLDDDQFTELVNVQSKARFVHATGVKMFIHLFYIMYRSLYLQQSFTRILREEVQEQLATLKIENFHVEASLDDFYNLTMFFDIAPACLLDYKHAFNGFFNNVSQAVYRHYPSYKRRNQDTLENIVESLDQPGFDVNILPCMRQLYPEIEYAWEDHHFNRVLCTRNTSKARSAASSEWLWFCVAGDFFLVSSDGDVFAADNVVTLTAYYIQVLALRAVSGRSAVSLEV
jgi:hypothetical protein